MSTILLVPDRCVSTWCLNSSVARFLPIDLIISGSNLPSAKLSLIVRRVIISVITCVRITRCSNIEGEGLDTAR